jgi:hypothetical protein
MDAPAKVAGVRVSCPAHGGTLQVKVGDSRTPAGMKSIGEKACNGDEVVFTASPQVSGQYVLVWFTRLPGGNKGRLNQISVYGTAG